ncbi:MAG: MBL fold metallo-hydrolase [Dehalococcoidia bacterium]|nr:MBL fold metallo-hydrolase [Dehalococcoidia bacterium]
MTQEGKLPTWKTEMKELAPGVYAYIQAVGGWFISNFGLVVGEDYAVVIDSLTSPKLTEIQLAEIKKVTTKPVRYLINTHEHGDHIWGNHLFTDAAIISTVKCREAVMKEPEIADLSLYSKVVPQIDFTGSRNTAADITFDKELTIWQDGRKGREIRLITGDTGHTPGDLIVYLPREKIVFAGDLLFYRCTPLCFVGSVIGWTNWLDILLSLDANTFVPGHGPVCGKEGVVAEREYFTLIYNEGRKRFDKGMSASDAVKDIDLGPFKEWGNWRRISANMERLYHEFSGDTTPIEIPSLVKELFAPDQP